MWCTEKDKGTNWQSRAVYTNRAINVAEHLQIKRQCISVKDRSSKHEVDLFDDETAQAMANEDDRPILTLRRLLVIVLVALLMN